MASTAEDASPVRAAADDCAGIRRSPDYPRALAVRVVLVKRPSEERGMVEILEPGLNQDEDAVLTAVEPALESGVPFRPHVVNLLGRLLETACPSPTEAP